MRVRRPLLLFLCLAASFAAASTGRVHVQDEVAALLQARAILESGTLVIPEPAPDSSFYGLRDREGRLRAPNGPAHALAVAPFAAVGSVLARAPGVPAEAADAVVAFAAVLSSAVFAALAATLLGVLLERLGATPRAAAAGTLALALGTPLLAYSAYLFAESLLCALLLGATLALFGRPGVPSTAAAAVAGALLGAAFLARPAQAIAVPLFAAALVARDPWCGWRRLAALGGAFGPAVVLYLAWNLSLYGHPLDFGYPPTADGDRALNGFETPVLHGLYGFLASPGKSILLFAPALVVGLAGLPPLFRRDRGLAFLAAALPAGYAVFYARYAQWEGGYCFGPRYLLPAITVLFVALGLRLDGSAWRRVVAPLVVAGALVQALGLATSFSEVQRQSGYYDGGFEYRMEHSPLAAHGAALVRAARAAWSGRSPAGPESGFDRWFVRLDQAGVARPVLWTAMAGLLAVAAWSGFALARALRAEDAGSRDGARTTSRASAGARGSGAPAQARTDGRRIVATR